MIKNVFTVLCGLFITQAALSSDLSKDDTVTLTLHLLNSGLDPFDADSPFYARQEMAKEEFQDRQPFEGDHFFTFKRLSAQHFYQGVLQPYGYYAYEDVKVSFSVLGQNVEQDVEASKGIIKPYNLKENAGRFFDVSLTLTQEEWAKKNAYTVAILGVDSRQPQQGILVNSAKPILFGGIYGSGQYADYYQDVHGNFHVFHKLTCYEDYDLPTLAPTRWAEPLVELFKGERKGVKLTRLRQD